MDVHILVVGAGPAALSACVALARQQPELCRSDALRVIDPAGGWLATWHHQMASQRIAHLRSPVVHHPHPEPFAMLRRIDRVRDIRRPDGLDLPTVGAFARFCADLVDRHDLGGVVDRGQVVHARLAQHATLQLADGRTILADHVVVATNPRRPVVPAWVAGLPAGAVHHGGRLRGRDLEGRRVLVVGGGLSAAHLALGAAADGARVVLVARRAPTVRRMDVDPRWLGHSRMGPFAALDARDRAAAVRRARGGGSMPAWSFRALRRAEGVDLWAPDDVVEAVAGTGQVSVLTAEGRTTSVDEVWLGTGGEVDPTRDPVLAAACRTHPVPVHEGLPDLEPDLRWGTAPVWVAGAAAALRLGPVAGNLYGHRHAGRRIADSLAQSASPRGIRG